MTGWSVKPEEVHEPCGSWACPICGIDVPHSHDAETIAFRRDQVRFRLTRLAEALDESCGFYSAMHRTYGTGFDHHAERVLRKELLALIEQVSA